jgi:hypothetical protein
LENEAMSTERTDEELTNHCEPDGEANLLLELQRRIGTIAGWSTKNDKTG